MFNAGARKMTNETIFITQLGSIIAFIVALFVLYSVLVNQKDATIQLLKEKIDFVDVVVRLTVRLAVRVSPPSSRSKKVEAWT